MQELKVIKNKLHDLLAENEKVTDIERLERDDFVIDVERGEQINHEGEQICEEIRKEAEKTTLKLELLKERVQ
jgi:cell division protein ZapA (FtsZ GTPase activity inhibitor)